MMLGLPVAWRASFIADSTASDPEPNNTRAKQRTHTVELNTDWKLKENGACSGVVLLKKKRDSSFGTISCKRTISSAMTGLMMMFCTGQ